MVAEKLRVLAVGSEDGGHPSDPREFFFFFFFLSFFLNSERRFLYSNGPSTT